MAMRYVIDTKVIDDYTAGSKARADIDAILCNNGFYKKNIYVGDNKKAVVREILNIKQQIREIFTDLENDSVVVFQYPWPTMHYSFAKEIHKICSKKNIKTIALIHDLNSVRTGSKVTRFYYNHLVKEIKFLDSFNVIISHNKRMKQYLINHGISENKIVALELFDYLANKDSTDEHSLHFNRINIAGNLSRHKTGYIYDLINLNPKAYSFILFGPNYEEDGNPVVEYKGAFPPDELPSVLNSGFGLVWDGNSIECCEGHFGEYLKINNPHKLSLYMACGIPVIVWNRSAISDFVIENEVGYAVNSLREIEQIMSSLSNEEYRKLVNNATNVQKKVVEGTYLLRSINKAFDILNLKKYEQQANTK